MADVQEQFGKLKGLAFRAKEAERISGERENELREYRSHLTSGVRWRTSKLGRLSENCSQMLKSAENRTIEAQMKDMVLTFAGSVRRYKTEVLSGVDTSKTRRWVIGKFGIGHRSNINAERLRHYHVDELVKDGDAVAEGLLKLGYVREADALKAVAQLWRETPMEDDGRKIRVELEPFELVDREGDMVRVAAIEARTDDYGYRQQLMIIGQCDGKEVSISLESDDVALYFADELLDADALLVKFSADAEKRRAARGVVISKAQAILAPYLLAARL